MAAGKAHVFLAALTGKMKTNVLLEEKGACTDPQDDTDMFTGLLLKSHIATAGNSFCSSSHNIS